jgi:hypothetical protein
MTTAITRVFDGVGARLVALAIGGYLWGALTTSIPAPDDPGIFWLGNLAAPYAVLPFLAGTWGFRAPLAAIAGAVTSCAGIAGFYQLHNVGDVTATQLDLPVSMTARDVVLEAYSRWFSTFVLGQPGGAPWLTIAAVIGGIAGVLGFLYAAKGVRLAAIVVACSLLVEPSVYVAGSGGLPLIGSYSLTSPNVLVWTVEALVGLTALALVVRRVAVRRPLPTT